MAEEEKQNKKTEEKVKKNAEEEKKVETLKESEGKEKTEKQGKKQDKKKEGRKGKKEEKKIEKKDKAVVRGASLRISTKSSIAVCKMISGKSPDKAIELLERVVAGKMPVRMASAEVAHQKSRGMKNIAGAKFPKKAAMEIENLVKQLMANSIVNGIENPVIVTARADKAARPFRKGGRKAKRTHIYLEAKNKTKSEDKDKTKSKNKEKKEEK
jgi:ribosomal protein L22